MDRLWNTSAGIVGIDISDNAIVYAEIVPTKEGHALRRFGEVSLPVGVVEKSVVVDAERLTEALRTLARTHRISSARASIGHEASHTLRMRIPVVSDSEIRPLVARMLEERFATPSNSLVFDYSISERTLEHVELIVHVSPKHVVDSHADVFSRAGITLVSLAPKSRALIGALTHPSETEATLIVDITESNTTATVVIGGVVASVSLLDFSSRQLDSDISPTFESAYPHMLRLKEAIRSCFLQWHLSVSTAGSPEVTIGKVILAGRNASFTGLAQYLSETLAAKVVVADPWRHVQLPPSEVPAISRSHAPRYATAIGLSIMGDAFGTLLPENARNYFRRARAIKVAILALLWVSVFSFVVFIFSVSI